MDKMPQEETIPVFPEETSENSATCRTFTRERLLIAIVALLCIVFAARVAFSWRSLMPGVNFETLAKIRPGMSESEVEEVFGSKGKPLHRWEGGRIEGDVKKWQGDETIYVRFENGKVSFAEYSPVPGFQFPGGDW